MTFREAVENALAKMSPGFAVDQIELEPIPSLFVIRTDVCLGQMQQDAIRASMNQLLGERFRHVPVAMLGPGMTLEAVYEPQK